MPKLALRIATLISAMFLLLTAQPSFADKGTTTLDKIEHICSGYGVSHGKLGEQECRTHYLEQYQQLCSELKLYSQGASSKDKSRVAEELSARCYVADNLKIIQ